MSQLETVYMMNVVLYFTTKRTIVHFVQINKKCFDAVKGLHRAPHISMLSLSSQLRMFPKLQHVSGDLLSFQNLVSLKQLQRISSFENENRNILTPIESIHKAFIGRIKQINITYPFPDLIKFKKLEEIRISFDREYLSKRHAREKVFLINAKDINEKIRYLKMLKRIILYDVSKEMFKKNLEVFGNIGSSIQIFIYYDDFINDSNVDSLPTNVHIITSKITNINPKVICLMNNQILPVTIKQKPQLDSIIFRFIEKTYYPACISIDCQSDNNGVVNLSSLGNVNVNKLILKSEFSKLILTPPNSPIETIEIVHSCYELNLINPHLKHLIVSSIRKIQVNQALESIQFKHCQRARVESNSRKECLSIIANANMTLDLRNIRKVCLSGVVNVELSITEITIIESDGIFVSFDTWLCYPKHLLKLTIRNVNRTKSLDLSMLVFLKDLYISNCCFKSIILGSELETFIYEKSKAEIVNSRFIPTNNINK
ncbi:hypothetical protein QTN25_006592 [Entamoeba marina]